MPKDQSNVPAEQGSDLLLKAPEVSVFMTCFGLVNELRRQQRAFESAEITQNTLLERSKVVLADLRTAVTATERFDIVMPVSRDGQFSPFFLRWFSWWEGYFKRLTVTQISELERQARELAIIDGHRPTGHWMDHKEDSDRCESWLIALGESLCSLCRHPLPKRKLR